MRNLLFTSTPTLASARFFLLSRAPLKPLDIVQNIDIWQVMIQNLLGTRAGTTDRGAQTFFERKKGGLRVFF